MAKIERRGTRKPILEGSMVGAGWYNYSEGERFTVSMFDAQSEKYLTLSLTREETVKLHERIGRLLADHPGPADPII